MTNELRPEESIRLFFEQFRQNLIKIRDELPTANPAQRAHLLLGQLREFEKMFVEMEGLRERSDVGAVSLSVLRRISDFKSFLKWIVEEQQLANLAGFYHRTRQRAWERFAGEGQMPELEPYEWLIKGSLARREEDGLIHYFVFAFSELRLVASFLTPDVSQSENIQNLLWYVAKVAPVYFGSPMNRPRGRLQSNADLIAHDPNFLNMLALVEKAAVTDVSILLEGESGTGKEMIANFIHQRSPRHKKAMIAVNCAAIPAGLIESELFGHEKGAFTGAYARQVGRIEEADGGTLFLDEIGEMELPMQAKLLRFLQLHEFHRVGGKQKLSVDVRIVAATNRHLKQGVSEGLFREDLYYRLSVMPFRMPPLRERPFDIAPLVRFFLKKYGQSFGVPNPEMDPLVIQVLSAYDFPGNVRELENLVQNMLVTSQGQIISIDNLPDSIRGLEPRGRPVFESPARVQRFRLTKKQMKKFSLPFSRSVSGAPVESELRWFKNVPRTNLDLKEMKAMIQDYSNTMTLALEKRFLDKLLSEAEGSMPKAAKMAGINRTLLYKMIERTKEQP